MLTLEVSHNGPLDIDIECSGNATGRKSTWTEAKIEVPELPGEYLGTLQWEAEHFDYKSMTCYGNAYNNGNRGYQGQGFVYTGAGKAASLRRFINVSRAGRYNLYVRYISKTKSGKYNLKVNGTEMQFPVSKCTEWTETEPIEITLNKGENEIMFYPPSTGTITMYLDCIKLKYLDAEKVMNNGLTVGRVALDDISQTKGVVEDAKQFFNISGNGLENDVVVSSKNKIVEFSFLPDTGFAEELIIDRNTLDDDLPAQPIYVRAKANTDLGEYKEQIVVKSGSVTPRYIDVNCVITPRSYTLKYVDELTAYSGMSLWYRASVSGSTNLMDDIVFRGITYDETVGIDGISADRQYNIVHQYFDMSGRQIQQPANGVYIERIVTKGGKKTVRKVMAKQ